MSLPTRVALFFLGMLAVTLTGFSVALYLLAAGYFNQKLQQRLESALGTLTAAVELQEDTVEWEGGQRRLEPGDDVRWLVRTPKGRVVASSDEPIPAGLLALEEVNLSEVFSFRSARQGDERWWVSQTRLQPLGHGKRGETGQQPAGNTHEGENAPEAKYPALVLTAAVATGPTETSLRQLLGALVGLSLATWAVAALLGSWLCRRALAPVGRMAESARSIQASEPGQRLAVDHTGDELETLGLEFNALLDRLQEAHERQRRFTGEASHQLRTPLAVMLGQVEVALRRERSPEDYRRVLGVVAEQSGRLQRIVEMLLFLARADAESALPGLVDLNLASWLEDHLRTWSSHPRSADVRLLPPCPVAGAPGLCAVAALPVRAHPALLGQVVDILLDNACKYSPPGTAITLSLSGTADRVLLTVADAGCGIAAEDLPRIFEPFFRSPRLRELGSGGVGLGLAIACRLATALGAEVAAVSEPGRGSRFTVRLVPGCGP